MTLPRRELRTWLIAVGGLLVAFLIVPQTSVWSTGIYTAVAVVCTITVLFAVARHPLWARSAWLSLAIGMALWTLADFVYGIAEANDTLGSAPSIYDLLYYIAYPPLIVAVGLFVREANRREEATNLIDSLIVMTAGGVLLLEAAIQPMVDNEAFTEADLFVMAGYVILDLLLLSLTVRLWIATDRRHNSGVRLVSFALACLLIADFWYQIGAANETETAPVAFSTIGMNFGFLMFFVLAGFASLGPLQSTDHVTQDHDGAYGRGRVLILLGMAVIVPTFLLVFEPGPRGTAETTALLTLLVTLGVLMAFRIGALVDRYSDALSRERHLRWVGKDLAKAQDGDYVRAHIQQYVRLIVGDAQATATLDSPSTTTADTTTAVLSIPAARPLTLTVSCQEPLSDQARGSLTNLAQSLGMTYDRLDLSAALVEQHSNERVESLLRHSSDVIALLSPDGLVIYTTPAAESAVGRPTEQLVGQQWSDWFTDSTRSNRLIASARRADNSHGDLVIRRTDGCEVHFDVVVTWLDDQRHFVVTHHDVTERHQLQQQLQHQAFHDPLTGLFNRVVFREELGRALRQARRSPGEFVVMMIDLDDFKTINDSLGHPAGDELLVQVAGRLVECLRQGDIAARLGGDEFAVILERTWSPEDAISIAQRILDVLAEPIRLGSTDVVVGASIGMAIGNASTLDADELERNADLALYQAKYSGKDRFTVYQPAMHADAVNRLKLTTELRQALDRGEIGVMYQPIVALASGSLVGMEALARWYHPERGLLQPAEFIPLAEETGLIQGLGRRVLEVALAEMAAWHRRYPSHDLTRIAVNMSGRQLSNPRIVDEVRELLTGSAIDPSTVILEITESVLLPGDGIAHERLQGLADLGVNLYIDDFGTGWSSLNALRSLPVRGVKLAREFVSRLPDPEEIGFVRAVLELAETLGLEAVVAEGLEQEEQRVALVAAGYRIGQGFMFGRPLKPQAAEDLLRTAAAASWTATPARTPIHL